MSVIKSLSFTSVPKLQNDPIRARRERLVERLREQKELVSNPSIVRTTQRIVRKDGAKTIVEIQQKVRPWWRADEKGQVVFFIRIGWRLLEFEKGKAGVVVGATDAEGGACVRDQYFTQDVGATIYQQLGIPLDVVFTSTDGRPISSWMGKPIAEIV